MRTSPSCVVRLPGPVSCLFNGVSFFSASAHAFTHTGQLRAPCRKKDVRWAIYTAARTCIRRRKGWHATRRCGPLPNYPGHLLLGRIVALVPDADYCYRCSVVCTCVCVCLLDIKPRAVLKRLNRSRFRSGCELGWTQVTMCYLAARIFPVKGAVFRGGAPRCDAFFL